MKSVIDAVKGACEKRMKRGASLESINTWLDHLANDTHKANSDLQAQVKAVKKALNKKEANVGAITTVDMGNNETVSRGITKLDDGTFLAMTYSQSKYFKTLKGAKSWMERKLNPAKPVKVAVVEIPNSKIESRILVLESKVAVAREFARSAYETGGLCPEYNRAFGIIQKLTGPLVELNRDISIK